MKLIILILPLFLLSCATKKAKDRNINFILTSNWCGDTYDLEKGIVYFDRCNSKGRKQADFSLTALEKDSIIDMYYECQLDELPVETMFNCRYPIMPQIIDSLFIVSAASKQIIAIDVGCKDYEWKAYFRSRRAKRFISFLNNILSRNPTIKALPPPEEIILAI